MKSPEFSRRNDPVAGALWMLASCALIAGVATLGRYATTSGVPPLQVMLHTVPIRFAEWQWIALFSLPILIVPEVLKVSFGQRTK